MSSADNFSIDPDELDDVTGDLVSTESALESLAAEIDREMATLQSTWEGLAAEAQAEAHQEWSRGMSGMRAALAELRAAARVAHQNYTGAADANRRLWEHLQ